MQKPLTVGGYEHRRTRGFSEKFSKKDSEELAKGAKVGSVWKAGEGGRLIGEVVFFYFFFSFLKLKVPFSFFFYVFEMF